MGTTYFAVCKDCKVYRGIDKCYNFETVKTRKEALEFGKFIKEIGWFRAGLIVSFMSEHMGHNCTFVSEHDTLIEDDIWTEKGEVEWTEEDSLWR